LEIMSTGRATADRGGIARADPADEQGEFALGCAPHPRRTAQARVNKDAPVSRSVQRTGVISSSAILGGLHHHYARV